MTYDPGGSEGNSQRPLASVMAVKPPRESAAVSGRAMAVPANAVPLRAIVTFGCRHRPCRKRCWVGLAIDITKNRIRLDLGEIVTGGVVFGRQVQDERVIAGTRAAEIAQRVQAIVCVGGLHFVNRIRTRHEVLELVIAGGIGDC